MKQKETKIQMTIRLPKKLHVFLKETSLETGIKINSLVLGKLWEFHNTNKTD